MSNAIYAALSRQEGLSREMQSVANNLANSSTTGYRGDRAIFAERLADTRPGPASRADGMSTLSMGALSGHHFRMEEGALKTTGAPFDLAIQGEGFFQVETPQGPRLTRAGHFMLSQTGEIISHEGFAVSGEGGGPVAVPEGAGQVAIAADGTVSAGGQLLGRIGVFVPEGPLSRESGTMFSAPASAPAEPGTARLVQGALEQSNVAPVTEMARLIEVQRAYEAGQSLLEREDQRIGQLIEAIRRG